MFGLHQTAKNRCVSIIRWWSGIWWPTKTDW